MSLENALEAPKLHHRETIIHSDLFTNLYSLHISLINNLMLKTFLRLCMFSH